MSLRAYVVLLLSGILAGWTEPKKEVTPTQPSRSVCQLAVVCHNLSFLLLFCTTAVLLFYLQWHPARHPSLWSPPHLWLCSPSWFCSQYSSSVRFCYRTYDNLFSCGVRSFQKALIGSCCIGAVVSANQPVQLSRKPWIWPDSATVVVWWFYVT